MGCAGGPLSWPEPRAQPLRSPVGRAKGWRGVGGKTGSLVSWGFLHGMKSPEQGQQRQL